MSHIDNIFYCLACLFFIYTALTNMKLLRSYKKENESLRKDILFSLNANDLHCLVRGGILTVLYCKSERHHTIKLRLQDITYPQMAVIFSEMNDEKSGRADQNKIVS